jgi:hypothetical protein
MKTIELNIDHYTKPQSLAGELKEKNLQQGDTLTVTSVLSQEMVLLIVLVALGFLNQRKMGYANELLKDIFDNKDSKEIQREIEEQYGIVVEFEPAKEDKGWQQFSNEKLAKAYGTDEPEYDESLVKEPNPDYKK